MRTDKITDEIVRIRTKIADCQIRLKELERRKIEMENTEIVELVRGVDVAPEELAAFIQAFKNRGAEPRFAAKEEENDEE